MLKPAAKNLNATGDLGKFVQQIENLKELGSDLKAKLKEVAKIREQIRESVNLGRKKAEEMMQQLEEFLGVNSPQPAMAGEYSSKHFPSQVPQKKPNVVEMSGEGVGGGKLSGLDTKIKGQLDNTILKRLEASDFSVEDIKSLNQDLKSNPKLIASFNEEPGLVEAWKLLENSARRTDIKVLKFFDDPKVVSTRDKVINLKIHERYPDIPIEELTAIRYYSVSGYQKLNTALRKGGSAVTDEYKVFEELLNSGLDKLPKYNGSVVYRGVQGNEAKLAKTWTEGDEILFKDFKSSSTSEAVTVQDDFLGDVIYKISNPKGYKIDGIATLPEEAEVLFKSGSKFRVKKIDPNGVAYDEHFSSHNVTKVFLELIK